MSIKKVDTNINEFWPLEKIEEEIAYHLDWLTKLRYAKKKLIEKKRSQERRDQAKRDKNAGQ